MTGFLWPCQSKWRTTKKSCAIYHHLQYIISTWDSENLETSLCAGGHFLSVSTLHLKQTSTLSRESLRGLRNTSRNHFLWSQFTVASTSLIMQRRSHMWTRSRDAPSQSSFQMDWSLFGLKKRGIILAYYWRWVEKPSSLMLWGCVAAVFGF